ncbi:tRNA (adenosine(37)-N6)-threonylcarbamoyltransferase complex ATPase subunit type 1 TsaE [Flavobacteriaceae bacterium LMO-SS05]
MERTYKIADIDQVAEDLLNQVTSKIILLEADMGVGKTTLIKALVKALGSDDVVTSPTFSIVNEYKINNDSIFHFDFYRIKNEEEALNFGIEDYLLSDSWIFMEWFEKIPNLLPVNSTVVRIKVNENASRTLILSQNILNNKKNAMEEQNFL